MIIKILISSDWYNKNSKMYNNPCPNFLNLIHKITRPLLRL